jgi:hypothetical protein
MMDYDQAKRLLLLHGPGIEGPDTDSTLEHGFLGCLRPYSGLRERNFHELVEAILIVGERFHAASTVDREIVYALWDICVTARRYGISPGGMLRRNKLITTEDVALLERWVDTIERMATKLLLGKTPPYGTIYVYAEYVVDHGWSDNYASFLRYMEQTLADVESGDHLEGVVAALGKLGPKARAVLPTLRAAEQRTFDWYYPVDRCTNESRECIQAAIRAIESEDR